MDSVEQQRNRLEGKVACSDGESSVCEGCQVVINRRIFDRIDTWAGGK